MQNGNIKAEEIAAIGITNQRETTIVWEKDTGKPVYNAIVWQCRRTAPICEKLKEMGLESYVKEHTGLLIDAYFSATKIKWILDNVPEAREAMEKFKYEVANEIGVPLKQGYNGDLTSAQNGYVGGYMVKKMIEAQEKQMAGK